MGSFTNGGKDARGDRRLRALLGHGSVDNRSLSKGGCLIADRPTYATYTNSPKVLSTLEACRNQSRRVSPCMWICTRSAAISKRSKR